MAAATERSESQPVGVKLAEHAKKREEQQNDGNKNRADKRGRGEPPPSRSSRNQKKRIRSPGKSTTYAAPIPKRWDATDDDHILEWGLISRH